MNYLALVCFLFMNANSYAATENLTDDDAAVSPDEVVTEFLPAVKEKKCVAGHDWVITYPNGHELRCTSGYLNYT